MENFAKDIRLFKQRKAEEIAAAGQLVAFRLTTGIDLDEALNARGEQRLLAIAKLRRLIERERLKGARRHWSYDLNRHIALKQALDRLCNRDPNVRRPRKPRVRRPKKETAPLGAV